MKLIKIGKSILIGLTIVGGALTAYRVGTYDKDVIYYHNQMYQEIISNQLAYIVDSDESIGVHSINDPPDNNSSQEIQYLSSANVEKEENLENNVGEKTNTNIAESNQKHSISTTTSKIIKTTTVPKITTTKKVTTTIKADPQVSYKPSINSSGSNISSDTESLRNEINTYRSSLGLPALIYDSSLQEYANIRAEELSQSFSHTRPNGEYAVSSNGKYRSEIIAKGSSRATRVVGSWKMSPDHNAIMISNNYTKFAVAHYKITNDDGTQNYWVTIFS